MLSAPQCNTDTTQKLAEKQINFSYHFFFHIAINIVIAKISGAIRILFKGHITHHYLSALSGGQTM